MPRNTPKASDLHKADRQMARRYTGPTLRNGKVQKAGAAGQLGPATSTPPKFREQKPTALSNAALGGGPAPAPAQRAPEPRHSVMKAPEGGNRGSDTLMVKPDSNSPVNRKKEQILRERAQEARATQARGLAQQRVQEKQQAPHGPGGPPPAPPSAQGGLGQPRGNARRGFGRDGQGNPFKMGR
ncbi:MAG: hypothetical protein JO051_00865 [Acidobacteriaceae bacterium]|nr:hypothetical protein [Acidobacteriaceae bacterium]